MNQLVHIFLTYSIIAPFIPDARMYFWPIAVFSILPDIDHIPGYIRTIFLSKKQKKNMSIEKMVDLFRTPIQEPIGILSFEILLIVLWFAGIKSILIPIAMVSIFMAWLIDFLTVHTRPLAPINNKIVCLFFKTKKQRLWSEIIVTILSTIIFTVTFLTF